MGKDPCDTCEYSPQEYYAPHVCKACKDWEKSYYYKQENNVVSIEKFKKRNNVVSIEKFKKRKNDMVVAEIIKKAESLDW